MQTRMAGLSTRKVMLLLAGLALVGIAVFAWLQLTGHRASQDAMFHAQIPDSEPEDVQPGADPAARSAGDELPQGDVTEPRAGPESPARQALQTRLDSIAQAYNRGDAAAAEKSLWANHAVVRPDGRVVYRSDLIGQWSTEWAQLRNRNLAYTVEECNQEAGKVSARWSLKLTADVLGEDGETHQFEFGGSQEAHYIRDGEEESLLEPIVYTRVYQTVDGYPVNPHDESAMQRLEEDMR